MRHPRKLDIARVDRFAGNFLDAVNAARVGARDLIRFSCILMAAYLNESAESKGYELEAGAFSLRLRACA